MWWCFTSGHYHCKVEYFSYNSMSYSSWTTLSTGRQMLLWDMQETNCSTKWKQICIWKVWTKLSQLRIALWNKSWIPLKITMLIIKMNMQVVDSGWIFALNATWWLHRAFITTDKKKKILTGITIWPFCTWYKMFASCFFPPLVGFYTCTLKKDHKQGWYCKVHLRGSLASLLKISSTY